MRKDSSPQSIAWAGAISLVVAMGFGRFAFTPLLPMMLHDHVIDLQQGSFLATIHYIGYLLGALICMVTPWFLRRFKIGIPSYPMIIRYSLVVIALLTFGMSFFLPSLWPLFRLLAGVTSAIAFVYTSGWCLEQLASLEALSLSGIIYTGPGIGIVISGVVSIVMISLRFSSAITWLGFAFLATFFTALIWNQFQDHPGKVSSLKTSDSFIPVKEPWKLEHFFLAIGYGLAGFGYIITATFLPVIAHEVIPNSLWINFFWPVFGASVVVGALLSQKIPTSTDRRPLLFLIYMIQAMGVLMVLWLPNQWGFILGSILVGLPFNMISLFGIQEARRLRPRETTTFIGLLTAMYGMGQILGPFVVALFLRYSKSHVEGFTLSLRTAAISLIVGALLYWVMKIIFPLNPKTSKGVIN